MVTEDFRLEYNHCRPHSSLGCLTPAAYAATRRAGYATPRISYAPPTRRAGSRGDIARCDRAHLLKLGGFTTRGNRTCGRHLLSAKTPNLL